MPTPIVITLYGKNDEENVTYTRKIVSWGLLKRAIRLGEELKINEEPDAADSTIGVGKDDGWLARFKHWLHRNDRIISDEEQMMDRISEFVVDVFDGQFTVQQLEDGAESAEIITVLKSIIARGKTMGPTNRQEFPNPKGKRKR